MVLATAGLAPLSGMGILIAWVLTVVADSVALVVGSEDQLLSFVVRIAGVGEPDVEVVASQLRCLIPSRCLRLAVPF